jgi:hypothetical protein
MVKFIFVAASIMLMLALTSANAYKINLDELKKMVALSEVSLLFFGHLFLLSLKISQPILFSKFLERYVLQSWRKVCGIY